MSVPALAATDFHLMQVPFHPERLTSEMVVTPVDVLGDAHKELVVATQDNFQIYGRTTDGYKLQQVVPVPRTANSSAQAPYYSFARLSAGTQRKSIVLFRSEGVYYYPSTDSQIAELPQPLLKHSIAQVQNATHGPQLVDLVLPLDNGPLDHLLLPEPDGFSIYRQSEPLKFSPVALPKSPFKRDDIYSFLRTGKGDAVRVPTYTISFRRHRGVENLLLMDTSGDGLQDLIYTSVVPGPNSTELEHYEIYPQRKGLLFDSKPSQIIEIPWDPRTEITLRDLNHDGRLDIVSVRSSIDIANPRTVTSLYYSGSKAEQTFERSSDRFVSKDPIGLVRVGDFNADGVPDFAMTYFSYQFSSADDIVDLALANKLKFKIQFFLGRGSAGYSHQPDAEKELVLNMKADSFHGAPLFYLTEDMNGDGNGDLVVRTGPEELAIYPSNGPVNFAETPAQTISVPSDASIFFDDLNGDSRADIIVASREKQTVSVFVSSAP